jgi:signal transduction histidine kinase
MYWYVTAVQVLLLLAAATSVIFALFAWKRRPVPGSVAFSVFMLAVALWVLAYLLQIVSDGLSAKMVWVKLQYIGVGIVPVAWLAFSLRYTKRQAWLTPGHWFLLMTIPLLTILFVLTNEVHQLVWVSANLVVLHGFSFMTILPGVWYWIFTLYLYVLFVVGSLMLVTSTRYEISSLLPQQALIFLAGLAVPWFGGILYLLGMSAINLTPLSFALCGAVVGKYALNFRFVKRTPLENQMVISSLADGVLVLSDEQMIVDANPALVEIAKRPLSAILGRQLREVFPEVAAKYEELKEKPLDIGCDGADRSRCYELKLSQLLDWRKLACSEMLVFHDISERKQQEILRDDLTHSMIHDLRSPISNSLFALDMLKNGTVHDKEKDSQRLVELTYENTERVLNLVNHILDVERLDDGNIPLQLTAVSLPKLVDQTLISQSPRAEAKGITLVREMPADLPVAWADRNLIERVMQNLVDNSIKFSPLGGSVKVTAVLVDKQDVTRRRIHITVADEGPGLSSALTENVFDKFVTGADKDSGNGLGLAFCQMALAAHNQKIWINRTKEPGAAFTFSLALPPQLPEDIAEEDEWPDIPDSSAQSNILFTQTLSNW